MCNMYFNTTLWLQLRVGETTEVKQTTSARLDTTYFSQVHSRSRLPSVSKHTSNYHCWRQRSSAELPSVQPGNPTHWRHRHRGARGWRHACADPSSLLANQRTPTYTLLRILRVSLCWSQERFLAQAQHVCIQRECNVIIGVSVTFIYIIHKDV